MERFTDNLQEIEIGSSFESFQRLLNSQRELLHNQIDQLKNVVVRQCKLTGVNPLSQEMAAGALSINIGKRPRDLLNPKAVKYMQAVFSIKDAISKKESREISALFSVTVTQVRDFFASQRSRVRKQVRLSREKAIRSNAVEKQHDCVPKSDDPMIAVDPQPLNSIPTTCDPKMLADPVPLNSVGPESVEETPSCSKQDEIPLGVDELDKQFVENIFSMMRKEETFSGQVKLLEWIMKMKSLVVLNWFLTTGGVMILATWLSQAAIEEQTSVLLVVLKVLCHLPLHNALPEHMSAVLQSVNRLRFYRTSDISNRARVLLSRWSKLFARSQAMKKPNGMKSSNDTHSQMLLKQSIVEIMCDESWNSNVSNPEENVAPSYEISENTRRLESSQGPKLLTSSTDESARKHLLGASSSYTRERRKVQLVEQPGQKTAGRSQQSSRTMSVNQGRPMSADDIQKAKMRAVHMQSKYGKPVSSSNGSNGAVTEGPTKPSATHFSNSSPLSKSYLRSKSEGIKKPILPLKTINRLEKGPVDLKQKMKSLEPLWAKYERVRIPWKMPPEMKLDYTWRVGAGENSKEIDVQKNRIRREKETVYLAVNEIPSNPKEPWDREMAYDDTLTPEIPTEQPPDTDTSETHATETLVCQNEHESVAEAPVPVPSSSVPEPDLELLAVLLKNPELVFALTSGQAGNNLSTEATVKLLDMIKAGGASLASSLNGLGKKVEEKVEVSLPSPTPSTDPGTSGWRPEAVRNPFSQQSPMKNRIFNNSPTVTSTIPSVEKLPAINSFMPPQAATALQSFPQQSATTMPTFTLGQSNSVTQENYRSSIVPNIKHSPVSITQNQQERHLTSLQFPASTPTETWRQPYLQLQPQQPQHERQPLYVPDSLVQVPLSRQQPIGNVGPVSDSWRARQGGLALNPPFSQANQNSYNNPSFGGGPMQGQRTSGPPPPRQVNEYTGNDGFESWSPDNSPTRSPEYNSRPRIRSSGWGNRTQQNSPGYWDHNRQDNRRWRDRRR